MQKVKLTEKEVEAAELPSGKREHVIWATDVPGFGLRLRGKRKTFILMYRLPGMGRAGNSRRLKIGTPESTPSIRDARRLALAELGRIAAGIDPASERNSERSKRDRTVEALLDRYETYLERRGHVCRKDVMSLLRRRLAPVAHRELPDLKGWDYADLIERVAATNGASAGDTFRTKCSTFLTWCAFDARVIETNPLAGYQRRRDTRQERVAKTERGRVLSDDELGSVWRAANVDTTFGRLVRFLILTGCRRNEAAKLEWDMVDMSRRAITLPATFTKQARGHTVYFGSQAKSLLNDCSIDARNPSLVFPSPRSRGPISGWSKIMDRKDQRSQPGSGKRTPGFVKRAGVDFTLHDLRRTFRTGLSRLGIDREIAELALGHARSDLEGRYNRDDCEDALRSAFEAWGDHMGGIAATAPRIATKSRCGVRI